MHIFAILTTSIVLQVVGAALFDTYDRNIFSFIVVGLALVNILRIMNGRTGSYQTDPPSDQDCDKPSDGQNISDYNIINEIPMTQCGVCGVQTGSNTPPNNVVFQIATDVKNYHTGRVGTMTSHIIVPFNTINNYRTEIEWVAVDDDLLKHINYVINAVSIIDLLNDNTVVLGNRYKKHNLIHYTYGGRLYRVTDSDVAWVSLHSSIDIVYDNGGTPTTSRVYICDKRCLDPPTQYDSIDEHELHCACDMDDDDD